MEILHYEAGDGRQERALHKRFVMSRRHGEWFSPSKELLAYIEARKKASRPLSDDELYYVPRVMF